MIIEAIRSYMRRWANIAWEFSMAMDSDPIELMHEDVCALKKEIAELRRQIGEVPESQKPAA